MQRRINEAEGKAEEIVAIADATSESIRLLAEAINSPGGEDALRLQLSKRYLSQLALLGSPRTTVLLPADITRLDELLASLGLTSESAAGK